MKKKLYSSAILRQIYKCKLCGRPLLMHGCDNSKCENFFLKNILDQKENSLFSIKGEK